jgi:high-affinity iron transporter
VFGTVNFVGEALLITLREGFEAALIVAIVLAAVSRGSRPGLRRWVWIGTAGAVVLSLAIGLVLHLTIDDLTGVARLRTFALICLAAAGLLTWMVFWMRANARSLKADLEDRVQGAASQSALALAGVAFVAVAREGLETALFLVSSTTASSGGQVLSGGLIGLAIAVVLGAAVYQGSRVIPLGVFFQVTGVLIIAFAAGLLSRAVQFLQAAGDLGTLNDAAYNLTGLTWLTVRTESGRFLAGILGWDPRPSAEQVAIYVLYLVPVLVVFFRGRPRRPRPGPVPSAESAGAAAG